MEVDDVCFFHDEQRRTEFQYIIVLLIIIIITAVMVIRELERVENALSYDRVRRCMLRSRLRQRLVSELHW